MIDPILFRFRIGNHNNHGKKVLSYCRSEGNYDHCYNEILLHLYLLLNGRAPSAGNVLNYVLSNIMCVLFLMIYMYIVCILMALVLKTSLYHDSSHTASETNTPLCTLDLRVHLNNCFLVITLNIFRIYSKITSFSSKISKIKSFFGSGRNKYSPVSTLAKYTFWVALINLTLIIICNPVITNPGPGDQSHKLSVLYHNIRGFISPNELGEPNPMLNTEKLFEFQSYMFMIKNLIL